MCFRPSALTAGNKCPACGADAAPGETKCSQCGAVLLAAGGPAMAGVGAAAPKTVAPKGPTPPVPGAPPTTTPKGE